MTYKEFESYINRLKETSDKLDKIADAMDCDIFIDLTGPMFDIAVELLETHFNDTDGWISYWMFDLDFGKLYKPGKVKIADEDVPLKTIEDLYELVKG